MEAAQQGGHGGIAGLLRLLREHGEALEPDLQRFYGIRLSQALYSPRPEDRYSARELLARIRDLATIPESSLYRRLRGRMAAWDDLSPLLLRQILLVLHGANWQRGGGKGQRPQPIPLPDGKGRGDRPAPAKASGDEIAQRLRNLGLIPAGPTG